AHTGDVKGRIEEGEGIGYAKLATGVKAGRALAGKSLLLDAGNVSSGSDLAEAFDGEAAGVLLDLLGYDAVAPGPMDFAYGAQRLKDAADLAKAYGKVKVL